MTKICNMGAMIATSGHKKCDIIVSWKKMKKGNNGNVFFLSSFFR